MFDDWRYASIIWTASCIYERTSSLSYVLVLVTPAAAVEAALAAVAALAAAAAAAATITRLTIWKICRKCARTQKSRLTASCHRSWRRLCSQSTSIHTWPIIIVVISVVIWTFCCSWRLSYWYCEFIKKIIIRHTRLLPMFQNHRIRQFLRGNVFFFSKNSSNILALAFMYHTLYIYVQYIFFSTPSLLTFSMCIQYCETKKKIRIEWLHIG